MRMIFFEIQIYFYILIEVQFIEINNNILSFEILLSNKSLYFFIINHKNRVYIKKWAYNTNYKSLMV